jgi:hypothetical protein
MHEAPLVPGSLYGLRTWTVVGAHGDERLAGAQHDVRWPADGAWLEADCAAGRGHAAPAPDCDCGIHAWHPRRRWARRTLAVRARVAGVVEASGAIEVHEDGFRAQRARPHALVLPPRRDPGLVRRLAAAYRVPVIETGDADAVVQWCRARDLGLDESVVAELIGPDQLDRRRHERARSRRTRALRAAAALAAVSAALAVGLVVTDDPGDRTLYGRTGEVHPR